MEGHPWKSRLLPELVVFENKGARSITGPLVLIQCNIQQIEIKKEGGMQLTQFFREKVFQLKYMLIAPAVIILLFITVYPFVRSLIMSFHEVDLASLTGGRPFVGVQNYVRALTSDRFWTSAMTTFQFVFLAVLTELVIGIIGAVTLEKRLRGFGKIVQGVVLVPMMLAPVVVGLLWKMMYNPETGVIPYVLSFLGFPSHSNWTGAPGRALFSVIIADVWQWTPFVILVLYAGLKSIPRFLYESADVDGASSWQKFRHITVPFLVPSFLVIILIRTMDAFKLFDKIYMLTMGGPGSRTETLSYYLYLQGFKNYDMGYAAAISFLMLLFVLIFSFTLINALRKRGVY